MKIGIVGLGRMGMPIARNIARTGHPVSVFDIDPQRISAAAEFGAKAAGNAAEVGDRCDAVVVSVPGPDADRDVLYGKDGLVKSRKRGLLIIDTTTITIADARDFARRAAEFDAAILEAPVSGSVHGAEAGTLTVIASGNMGDFERATPVLKLFADKTFFVGPSGSATALKLINQAIYIAYMSSFAEGLALGESIGLSTDTLLDVLGQCAAGNPMIHRKFDEIRGLSNTRFSVANALSFLNGAAQIGKDDAQQPVIAAVRDRLAALAASGHGADDVIVSRKFYSRR